jgi:Na+/H+-dicarboxylate symporter
MSETHRHPASFLFASRSAVKWLTVLCLAGLAAGVLAGVLAARFQPPGAGGVVALAEALVRAWTNAFRLLVAPLVMAQLYLALAGAPGEPRVKAGRLGALIPVVFGGLLALVALISLLTTPVLLLLPWFADLSLSAGLTAPVAVPAGAASGSAWVDGFIPPNLFAVATTDNILPLMLFTLAFAYASRRADDEARETLSRLARGIAQTCFTLVGWLLLATPLVMLALGFRSAVSSGVAVGEVVLAFAALEIVLVLLVLILLYLAVWVLGGVPLGRFARALWPAQLTAIATRSSLATLPALLGSSTTTLKLREETAAAVLPVAGATLKLSRAVSGPVKLLFLAHVLGISITPERLLIFALTIILLSASTVGVPSVTSGNRSLPAYVAAGVPAEYVVLLGVAVSLTDIFLTVLNSSGYLAAAAIVDRYGARIPTPADPPGSTGLAPEAPGGLA